jgi:hypothetical protein
MAFLDELEDALKALQKVVLRYGRPAPRCPGLSSLTVTVHKENANFYIKVAGFDAQIIKAVSGRSDGQIQGRDPARVAGVIGKIVQGQLDEIAKEETCLRERAKADEKRADDLHEHQKQLRDLIPSPLEALAQEAE